MPGVPLLHNNTGPTSPGNRLNDGMSIHEIKAKAQEQVTKQVRGASAMSLIKAARTQLSNAKEQEAKGDLKGALSCYVKTAQLLKLVSGSTEFKQDTKGVIRKEWEGFFLGEAQDLTARSAAVEEKLKVIEKSQAREMEDDGPNVKPGGSRFPSQVTKLPTPPMSPSRIATTNGNGSMPSAVPPTPVSPSPHTLISASSFGPPSPSSSPSSSPQLDLSGFSQAFPSIEELDESPSFSLPSAPTGIPSDPPKSVVNKALPANSFRDYAVQIERPSIRPGSPSRSKGSSNLSPKPPLPVKNTALPRELLGYIRDYNVLIIDADAVVCVEPTVLMRGGIDADQLENAMVIGPRAEASLFENRDKFDLVAVYDQSSTTFGGDYTPFSILVRIISERAIRKMLKRMPMMLVGGLDAWKQEFGGAELVRSDPSPDVAKAFSPPTSPNPNNPFTNGMLNSLTSGNSNSSTVDSHKVWTPTPRPRPAIPSNGILNDHRPTHSLDISGHSRSPADYSASDPNAIPSISRRPAMMRNSISVTRSKSDLPSSPLVSPQINGTASSGPITYPSFTHHISPTSSGSAAPAPPPLQYEMPSPPQASINPTSQLSRRRSDFVDQSQEAMSAMHSRVGQPIDYPELMSSAPVLRPPPAAASPALERHNNRQPPYQPVQYTPQGGPPKPPRINSDYPVTFWADVQIGTSGLKNLGNTCYMNAPIQCLSATVPFSRFFTDGRWKSAINFTNKLGSQGKLVQAFAKLLHEMWGGDLPYLTPNDFRRSICSLNSQYIGSDQHDSQEFLSFLLDGIHEDIQPSHGQRPSEHLTPEQEEELNRNGELGKRRNDSLIVDFFQGQFKSRIAMFDSAKRWSPHAPSNTSTTYNCFLDSPTPIPHSRSSKRSLEKDDAWDCPQCKTKRRASKTLSLARLPPILLIHLKRFEANGRFSDKVDTFVEYPMKSLDLTNYMPPPLPPGADKSELNGGLPMSPDDPRTQLPPYRSGHYTAYIASRGGWMLCDDSSVKQCDPKQVVVSILFPLLVR
ncbi:ubiquitin carboxyl-terminal hydrolase 4 [Ephemerocybe angulata]|uniref:ubiquitinyl hydrolase 1 n=1 Tax=Ephemerocybe angulata TaxID=980116 RepID=A0A8H6MB32_9AGAR|nr:ubiquitin carboxyl-terminal hydrolase 4 [Tulosesus angulatus]